jgi:PAS domain S-box-containing protein
LYPDRYMIDGTALLEALPVAVYTTDAAGNITFYNSAAAELWGHRPELGSDRWCGSWKLFWPDGTPMAHDECPMAVCLREGREVRGGEAIAERPDGTRVPFVPYPTPLKDAEGRVIGAINLLVDATDQGHREIESARLAAIVEGSDDAIVSKTLDGTVTFWNSAATRIFGYEAEEMIGASILRIVPPDLHEEEAGILARLRKGERIEHFDTVRLTRDGRRVDISLTVSPMRDHAGRIIGASKVARDVTERKRTEELQNLLFEELNHRVKNTLATIQAIAGQSLRRAPNPTAFVSSFNGRVQALARAHDLLVQGKMQGSSIAEIVRDQVVAGGDARIGCSGPYVLLDARAAVHMGLVLHELSTNARKYGALSVPDGKLSITWHTEVGTGRQLVVEWNETGAPDVTAPTARGFGSQLIERTLDSNGGTASIRYDANGVSCSMRLPLSGDEQTQYRAAKSVIDAQEMRSTHRENGSSMNGKRILLIEDEALVAMEIESELIAAGCEVIGPAANIDSAMKLIEKSQIDAALVDANLAGRPVDELAIALTKKGVPFAFATGYGRDGLPKEFRDELVLTKPFSGEEMLAVVRQLLSEPTPASNVVKLKP